MPFGWFGGNEKLDQQKAALAECTESLAYLEKRVTHLAPSLDTIHDRRPELALHTLTKGVFDNMKKD